MIAFAIGGTPMTTLIGTDENDLSWTVTQPVGSQLILSVVDANGSAGGIPPNKMNVIAGQTTGCVIAPLTSPPFTVTANVTKDLRTCRPWGLTVKGGAPPYMITLASPNSPIVTNATLAYGDDAFTYINRADPGGELIAAISDLTGRWATGTPIVDTQGSSDTTCTGLVSSSGNSTIIKQADDAANAIASASTRKRSIIIGVSVTLASLALIGLCIAAFFWIRTRRQLKRAEEAVFTPHQFIEVARAPGQVLSISELEPPRRTWPSGKAATNAALVAAGASQAPTRFPTASPPSQGSVGPVLSFSRSSTLTNTNANSQSRTSRLAALNTSIGRNPKTSEAGYTVRSPESAYPETAISPLGRVDEEGEIIFQHRDRGRVVRELPPPYGDGIGASRS